ncbi:MAG TPA: phasin family protein [Aromatoleum sp.]|uniref:phasin family protein n=1 Tax=Aromatoleum sp. TaxID=2307007 RepID=UPI002B489634|nr:phasin family protein [Aromatoleum sp.]HJV24718.1 phasin family protein [Aromatoleum sp.]
MSPTPHMSTERRINLQGIDAFLALSQVYLDCVEHLAESTVAVSRAAVDDCVAAAKASVSGNAVTVPAAVGQSLIEKALAYSRDSYETVTNAQVQSAQILGRQFGMPAVQLPFSDEWKGAFDAFTKPWRDISRTAESAVAKAAGRAPAYSPSGKPV